MGCGVFPPEECLQLPLPGHLEFPDLFRFFLRKRTFQLKYRVTMRFTLTFDPEKYGWAVETQNG